MPKNRIRSRPDLMLFILVWKWNIIQSRKFALSTVVSSKLSSRCPKTTFTARPFRALLRSRQLLLISLKETSLCSRKRLELLWKCTLDHLRGN